jgi:hypothetical protein
VRANIVVAVGIEGSRADCERFVELMRADFEHRCHEAAREIMRGRIHILPLPEVTHEEYNNQGEA